MTTYKDSGVDVSAGNDASACAYDHAKRTFASRKGTIGAPVSEDGGFAGLLDMGDFYLVQCDDGTGSKMELACAMEKFDTIGRDLLAMVIDDAICTGAEVMSVSNTLDVEHVEKPMIDALLKGLADACVEQKIVIPGGEIAEVPGAVSSPVWNATAVGIVAKDKVIDTATIKEGDRVIALRSKVARSNGFSLIRKILTDTHGKHWHAKQWKHGMTWGDIMLTPSIIYHGALLTLLGRYGEKRIIDIKGLAHITGGGIAENFKRILKKSGCGAHLTDLWPPHEALNDLISMGKVPLEDAYRTWNMGNGMLAVVDPRDTGRAIAMLAASSVEAKVAGTITRGNEVTLHAFDGSVLTDER